MDMRGCLRIQNKNTHLYNYVVYFTRTNQNRRNKMSISITITDPTDVDMALLMSMFSKSYGVAGPNVMPVTNDTLHDDVRPIEPIAQLKVQDEAIILPTPQTLDVDECITGVVIPPPPQTFDVDECITGVIPPPPQTPDVDVNGEVWDAEKHSAAKSKLSDGTWRMRRNVAKPADDDEEWTHFIKKFSGDYALGLIHPGDKDRAFANVGITNIMQLRERPDLRKVVGAIVWPA